MGKFYEDDKGSTKGLECASKQTVNEGTLEGLRVFLNWHRIESISLVNGGYDTAGMELTTSDMVIQIWPWYDLHWGKIGGYIHWYPKTSEDENYWSEYYMDEEEEV